MTVSTFMRRTAAIGATVVAVCGFAASQALASTPQASAPGHAKLVATATAAARTFSPDASGGGCSQPPGQFAAACISVSGNQVLPDAYVNSLPFGCSTIGFFAMDLTTGTDPVQATIGCHTGHFSHPFPGIPGHVYESRLVYSYNNFANTIIFTSPPSFF
ncbi:MAG TPA: hypothetical protein VFB06_26235 [Streptosporangiaceae bacterium]|nr:hypothetical protein [Streptosporangiaceae bacterium]